MINKAARHGWPVSVATVQEQTLYEVPNPHTLLHARCRGRLLPGPHRARGREPRQDPRGRRSRTQRLLQGAFGYHDCFIGEGQISYGGENALAKAELARDVLEHRFDRSGSEPRGSPLRLIGFNSLYGDAISHAIRETSGLESAPPLRSASALRLDRLAEMAHEVGREVEALYTNGPAGGGGATASVRDIISIASILDRVFGLHHRRRASGGIATMRLMEIAHSRTGDKGNSRTYRSSLRPRGRPRCSSRRRSPPSASPRGFVSRARRSDPLRDSKHRGAEFRAQSGSWRRRDPLARARHARKIPG